MRYFHLTHSLTLRLTESLSRRLREVARADDRTPSEYVRELLRRELLSKAGTRELGRGGSNDSDAAK